MTSRHHRISPLRLLPGLLFLLLACAALVAARLSAEPVAAVRYVSPVGSDGGGNLCLDPAAPCATLARALVVAQAGDAVHLAAGDYQAAGLMIDKTITMRGEDAATTRLDGQGQNTLLIVAGSGALTLEDMTLRGGNGLRGGAMRAESGAVTLRRVTVEESSADWGGAVYATGATITIEDSRLVGNTAGVGGAIYATGGTLTVIRSDVDDNDAGAGGGFFIGAETAATLRAVTFTNNRADTVGGGIYIQSGGLMMANTVMSANRAGARGGGLFNDGGTTQIDYATFLTNAAPAGAAIAAQNTTAGQTQLGTSILKGATLCAGVVTSGNILADDATCGQPAQPATYLDPNGRPAYGSNAIDAGSLGPCLAGGATLAEDRRGEPRPAGDGGAARCDLGAFEFQPRLTIRHVPNLSDGTRFVYSGGLGEFTLSAAERPRAVFEAIPGSIRVEQQPEPGWKVTAITCAGDNDGGSVVDVAARAVTVDLDHGEAISCVFSARPNRDTIGITVSGPAGLDPAVSFGGGLGAFELRPATQSDMHSGRLAAGLYTIQSTPPFGMQIAAIECAGDRDGGSTFNAAAGQAHIDLDDKEAIGCTFSLVPTASTSLTVRHESTASDDPLPFVYTGDLGTFALQAGGEATRTFPLPPGTYRLHELIHPAWALGRLDCDGDVDAGTILLPEEATALIDLDAGEAITCVFGHVPATSGLGTILIEHAPTPADGTPFAFNGSLGDFTLLAPANSSRAFAQLTPGNYTVRLLSPAGWVLSSLTCDGDADNGTTLLPDETTALIDLDEDEVIRCVFASARPAQSGAITIIHEPTPADETQFRYNGTLGGFNLRAPSRPSRAFVDLAPGSYTVGARPQDGWTLYAITCDGDTDGGNVIALPNRQVTVDLDAGEAIVCRFTHAGPGVTVTPTPSPTPPSPTATPTPGEETNVYLPVIR